VYQTRPQMVRESHVTFMCCVDFRDAANSARMLPKSQVIIRRTAPHRNHPRAHVSDDIADNVENLESFSPASAPEASLKTEEEELGSAEENDEISHLRQILAPPPIPGVIDWGVPPVASSPCDPAIQV
jgi:hypothetical protein